MDGGAIITNFLSFIMLQMQLFHYIWDYAIMIPDAKLYALTK